MTGEGGPQLDAFAVDVRALLERSVANLYSHLITRPTGRAVRMAIEHQLAELRGPALSLVDLSSVAVLDYSCADEVVAKLILRYGGSANGNTYFVLQGMREHHREPIEAVLERHELAVVAQTRESTFELLGVGSEQERAIWTLVQERRRVPSEEVPRLAEDSEGRAGLELLLRRRLLFRDPLRGDLHALSTLIRRPG